MNADSQERDPLFEFCHIHPSWFTSLQVLSRQLRKEQLERKKEITEDHLTQVIFRNRCATPGWMRSLLAPTDFTYVGVVLTRLPDIPVDPKVLKDAGKQQEYV